MVAYPHWRSRIALDCSRWICRFPVTRPQGLRPQEQEVRHQPQGPLAMAEELLFLALEKLCADFGLG